MLLGFGAGLANIGCRSSVGVSRGRLRGRIRLDLLAVLLDFRRGSTISLC